MMYGMNGFGMSGFGLISMILFWGLILALIVILVRWIISEGQLGGVKRKEESLEILKKRYARGEIDREEFEEKKRELLE
ncbi:MAG: SHOCT domain-containing protein [Candidatus Hydrothermarchaeota archaeon]